MNKQKELKTKTKLLREMKSMSKLQDKQIKTLKEAIRLQKKLKKLK